jgi:selenoprotein W-related protein
MNPRKPRVEIEYCSQCRFILRASWLAQELLMTFGEELGEVALVPGSGGIFDASRDGGGRATHGAKAEVRLDGERLWNKKDAGRYPEPKEIKQQMRDRIAPGLDLGHSDRKPGEDGS